MSKGRRRTDAFGIVERGSIIDGIDRAAFGPRRRSTFEYPRHERRNAYYGRQRRRVFYNQPENEEYDDYQSEREDINDMKDELIKDAHERMLQEREERQKRERLEREERERRERRWKEEQYKLHPELKLEDMESDRHYHKNLALVALFSGIFAFVFLNTTIALLSFLLMFGFQHQSDLQEKHIKKFKREHNFS